MRASDFAKEFIEKRGEAFRETQDLTEGPEQYAEQYVVAGSIFPRAESVLKGASFLSL